MRPAAVICGALALLAPAVVWAQPTALRGLDPLATVLLLAALALLPFALVLTTSFIKFAVVLSILRNALGTPQVPPTVVITGLALLLTAYVMAPTGAAAYAAARAATGDRPPAELLSGSSAAALYRGAVAAREPLRRFLLRHSHARDRAVFLRLARRLWGARQPGGLAAAHLLVVVPAFVIGQLTAAFKIGFLLFVPFLVIDLVVANVLLSLGMHMLSPTTVSLPFKLLLFVLVDGWSLLTRSLVLSFT